MKKVGITVAAAVCVVLLCVGFYFMKNSDGSQASKENLTVVQRINEKNLTDDYPKTPRAVIKLYNQIITSYYSGNYTDDFSEAAFLPSPDTRPYGRRSRALRTPVFH